MGFKDPGFTDRQKAANEARKALLERFKAQPGPDDPSVLARAAERAKIVEQREQARILREARKADEKRIAEEFARAEAERLAREEVEAAAARAALELEQKAARDARYAARKKRKKR
jgi:hypothetical protein